MELRAAAPLISFALAMLLIVFTGTAWFAALHPRFVRQIIQGGDKIGDELRSPYDGFVRRGGVLFGAIGLLLLLLADRLS